MLLWLTLVSLLVALAGDDQIRVTVVVDDREAGRLGMAQVVVDHSPPVTAALSDDGRCAGDMPDDHILTACFDVQKRETLSFGVLQAGERLGAFNLFLPNAEEATVSLRARAGSPALLLDMAAEQPMYSAPDGPGLDTTPKDVILVMVTVDDAEARSLVAPVLVPLDREGVDPVRASDAGLLPGDVAGDGLWRAELTLLRTASLALALEDEGRELGRVEVSLPLKPRTALRIQRDPGGSGLLATLEAELPTELAADSGETCLLVVELDDRAATLLSAPVVSVAQPGVEPQAALDDGSSPGDVAQDHIFVTEFELTRNPRVVVTVRDGDSTLGSVGAVLPAKESTTLRLRTRHGSPAIMLVEEQSARGGTGGGSGGGSLWPLVWLNLGLFAVLFVWVRRTVRRAIQREVGERRAEPASPADSGGRD